MIVTINKKDKKIFVEDGINSYFLTKEEDYNKYLDEHPIIKIELIKQLENDYHDYSF